MTVSEDGFLNQQLRLLQPQKGYRIAIDPIFLAASLPLRASESVLDCGCGVGAIGCFLLFREPSLRVVGVEKNQRMLDLATQNHNNNRFGISFQPYHGDMETLKLAEQFDHVVSNPPFYDSLSYQRGAFSLKSEAHEESVPLKLWVSHMLRHLKKGGWLTLILPPERLGDFFQSDLSQLGGLCLYPLWAGPNKPARRLILQGQKGAKKPLKLLKGLVLHDLNGAYTQEADAILKGSPLTLER